MKSIKLSFMIAALFGAMASFAQTADDVANKYIDAIGGKDNWKKVNTVVTEGAMKVQGADVALVMTAAQGRGNRQDISVMGMTGYQIMTPTAGWSYMPFQGQTKAEPATAEMVKLGADQLDVQGALVDYATKGHSIELLGKEDVDGSDCYKLKINYKSGKVETYFIDASSYLLVKSITKQSINGQEMEMTTTFSNYQKTPEGLILPMAMTVPLGPGLNADMTITKISINKPVDDSTFKPTN